MQNACRICDKIQVTGDCLKLPLSVTSLTNVIFKDYAQSYDETYFDKYNT